MSFPPRMIALGAATVLLLSSCGDSDDPDDSSAPASGGASASAPSNDAAGSPEGPDGTEGTDGGGTVTRGAFCADIDPQAVADLLGIAEARVIADHAPGDEIPSGTDAAPIVSPYWTCTIGTTTDGSIGATWNVGNVDAEPEDVAGTLQRQSLALEPENCTDVGDDTLGPDTRGIDCSLEANGAPLALAARSTVVDGTQLDCSIASSGRDDLEALTAALPEMCSLFLDAVVG